MLIKRPRKWVKNRVLSTLDFSGFTFFLPVLLPNRLPALLSALDFLAHLDLSLHTLQLLLGIDQTKMRVGIQSNTDIRMPHQILEGVRIHAFLGFLAAVGVPAYMRSDLRHLHPVDLVIFLSEF